MFRRSLYSLAAMYVNTGIVLISGLVATPLLLVYLGEQRVGLARTALEYLNYIALLSLGIDGMLNVHFAKAAAHTDRSTTVAALRAGMRAYFRVSFLACVWVAILIAFTPTLFGLATADEALARELRLALCVYLLGMFVIVLGVFRPLIEAEQRGYLAHIANAIGTFTALAASLLFAYLGFGLPGQLLALVIAPLTGGLILAVDVIRRYPEVLARSGPRFDAIRVLNPTIILVSFFNRVSFMSDCIIVTLVLGTAPVAMFTLSQRLLWLLFQVVNGLGNSTWSALVNLYHKGETEKFHRRLLQLTRMTATMAIAVLIPAAVWNGPFVRAWTSQPQLYAGDTLSLLTALSLALFSIVTLWSMPMTVAGLFTRLLPVQIVGGVVSLTVGATATHFLGVIGPPIGVMVNLLGVMGWWMARIIETEFGTCAIDLAKAAAGPFFLAGPYYGALCLIAGQFSVDTLADSRILRLGIVALLIGTSAAVYIAIALTLLYPAADRIEFLQRFRRRAA